MSPFVQRSFAALFPMFALLVAACGGSTAPAPGGSDASGQSPSHPTRIYAVNAGSANVSVIDVDKLSVVQTIAVGKGPSAIAVDNHRNRAYVANGGADSVSVINTKTAQVVGTLTVGAAPTGVAVDPLSDTLFVAVGGSNSVAVIDLATSAAVASIPVGASPAGVALNPARGRLYVANAAAGSLSVIDTASRTVIATVGAVGTLPTAVAADPTSSRVYVSGRAGNRISVLDATTNSITATVIVGNAPAGLAISDFDDRVYVANSASNSVSVLSAYDAVLGAAAAGGGPEAIALDPQHGVVYVANKGANTVSVVDAAAFGAPGAASTVSVGTAPSALAAVIVDAPLPIYSAVADLGTHWTVQPTLLNKDDLSSVAAGAGTFVAVGRQGLIRSSSDGLHWTTRSSGTQQDIKQIEWLGTQFLAVGAGGTILSSIDGTVWVARSSTTSVTLNGIARAAATYLVVGDAGTLLTSADGIAWSARSIGSANLNAVAVSDTMWVAVGSSATVLTSPDGQTWTANMSGFSAATLNPGTSSALSDNLNSIVFAGGLFVAEGGVANANTGASHSSILTSPDGIQWSAKPNVGSETGHLRYVGGQFLVAVPEMNGFQLSSDAKSWTYHMSNPVLQEAQAFKAVQAAYADGVYVAVGPGGSVGTSSDGVDWSRTNTGTSTPVSSITFGNGEFAALVQGGTDTIRTTDGVDLVTRAPIGLVNPDMLAAGNGGAGRIRYLNSQFLAVGNQGRIVNSPDGVHWSEHFVPGLTTNGELTSVTWGKGLYVAVGSYSVIATSPDAVTWTVVQRKDTNRLYNNTILLDVVFLDGQFVALGQGGTLVTSVDGVTWTTSKPRANNYNATPKAHDAAEFHGIAYGNGTYAIAGVNFSDTYVKPAGKSYYPSLITSSDGGKTWIERADSPEGATGGLWLPGIIALDRVLFADGRFFVVSRSSAGTNKGSVFSSRDAVHWVDRTPPGMPALNFEDMAFGNNRLLVVGGSSEGSLVLTSP